MDDKKVDDPRLRQHEPGEETLKLGLQQGHTAQLQVPSQEPDRAQRIVQFTTPKVKLIREADSAIRGDLAHFPKALAAYEALVRDEEARADWDMANYITMRKLGYNDHGRVHAWVTGAASLAILELLTSAGVVPDVIDSEIGDLDDTYVVVLLGTMLHDIGNQVQRVNHESFGVMLAKPILDRVLSGIYQDVETRTKLRGLILHSIYCHDLNPPPLTIEAAITAIADGTDITKGRGKRAFSLGSVDIHSISALAVEQVSIARGLEKPVEINVLMNNSAGIFQVEETLTPKITQGPLENYISLNASTDLTTELDKRIVYKVSLHEGRFINLEHEPNANS